MVIYCIKNNKNDKCYIGQTLREYNKRKWRHKYKLNRDNHNNPYLQNSWNKYGEDNFKWVVLERGFDSVDELNEAEVFWIQYLQTMYYQDGYNLRSGGKNDKLSEETIQKIKENRPDYYGKNNPFYGKTHTERVKEIISKVHSGKIPWNKGISHSEETKRKISEALSDGNSYFYGKTGKDHPNYGKKLSEEHKRKIGESSKEMWERDDFTGNSKKVRHIKTGLIFESEKEASDYFDIHDTTVGWHCRGGSKTQKFEFIND